MGFSGVSTVGFSVSDIVFARQKKCSEVGVKLGLKVWPGMFTLQRSLFPYQDNSHLDKKLGLVCRFFLIWFRASRSINTNVVTESRPVNFNIHPIHGR